MAASNVCDEMVVFKFLLKPQSTVVVKQKPYDDTTRVITRNHPRVDNIRTLNGRGSEFALVETYPVGIEEINKLSSGILVVDLYIDHCEQRDLTVVVNPGVGVVFDLDFLRVKTIVQGSGDTTVITIGVATLQ